MCVGVGLQDREEDAVDAVPIEVVEGNRHAVVGDVVDFVFVDVVEGVSAAFDTDGFIVHVFHRCGVRVGGDDKNRADEVERVGEIELLTIDVCRHDRRDDRIVVSIFQVSE